MKNIFKILTGSLTVSAALALFSTTASAAPNHHEAQRVVAQHVVQRSHHVNYRPHHVAYRPHHGVYRPHYVARHHGYHHGYRHQVRHHYYR